MSGETTSRILVVDDTTANLQLLTNLLTGQSYTVYPASDGELALEFVRTTLPDLILLDIRMPGMDGFEVCRRLKADERTRDIPVIFISILEDERDKVDGFKAGAVDYITKPFQPEEILARIQTQLRLRELTERLEQKVAERTEELHRLNRELRAISDCNQVLVRAEDEQTLLSEICRIVCDEAGYRMAAAGYAENDEKKSVRLVAWGGMEDDYLAQAELTWADTERGRGPAGVAIRSGKTECSQDIATDPCMEPWRENALQRGYRSIIALPLMDEYAHVFGVFLIYSSEPNAFTPDEIRILEELAGDLAYGIQALRNRNARRESERIVALLSFALNNVREAAFLIDEQARLHYVNEESCRVLGYGRDELLALGVADVDPDFPVERWPEHWAELKNRRSLTFESRHKTKDGRIFPVELSANYLEYEGQDYNLALARDITERKRAEEALHLQTVELEQEVAERQMTQENLQEKALLLEVEIEKRQETQEELQRLNKTLEQRVKERTTELEEKNAELHKMNRIFVGRELRMVELKERIRELEREN